MSSRPTVAEVMLLVRAYYEMPDNGSGGSLHIVLDDGNMKDSHVQFCIDYAKEKGDQAGVDLGEMILRMSQRGRWRLFNEKYQP